MSVGAAWFDYDSDGLLDPVVANYTIWSPQTNHRCAAAGVEYYCDPRLFYEAVPARLYRNLGHGRFEDVSVSEPWGFGGRAALNRSSAIYRPIVKCAWKRVVKPLTLFTFEA